MKYVKILYTFQQEETNSFLLAMLTSMSETKQNFKMPMVKYFFRTYVAISEKWNLWNT
jgi:ABC-type thiamin/hydroxymethylpyrimidine transport system permease subunit